MKVLLTTLLFFVSYNVLANDEPYFPPPAEWQTISPEQAGFNPAALQLAVEFAGNNEYSGEKDLRVAILKGFRAEPFHKLLGPTKKRGGPAGMILKNGYQVASWGDTRRVDMTFSVTKSYLTTVAGLAWDAKLIRDVNDPVAEYVWDGTFDGAHNSKVRWEHLLNQSSDWSGQLFGIKDWADRPPSTGGLDDWRYRELREPGTVMEYNDVRVNLLAYSLLHVWRTPLPQVLKNKLMDPIGASSTWRWFGYDDAWVNVDGQMMQSVTGGGHSGGGIFISTEDHARFGLLIANHGKWQEQQLISKQWLDMAIQPSPAHDSYGYMWWLNQGQRKWQDVDNEDIFYAAGFGGNFIVIDRSNDLVIVTRWLEPREIGKFVSLVLDAME
ncbi:serine hydrolase domain-containing protein [Aestuariibacter salexigens]|uniref:serine hydrolase domain-containing protein n=1 Tax=Aestuariibacter salexigens TaxID=226010 RepID=UPI0004248696|nr:serine hydrolase [Aestuariibacter salexigens]